MPTVWAVSLGENCEGRTKNVRLRLGSRILVTPSIQFGRHLFDSHYVRIYSLKRSVESRCYVHPNSVHLVPVIFTPTAWMKPITELQLPSRPSKRLRRLYARIEWVFTFNGLEIYMVVNMNMRFAGRWRGVVYWIVVCQLFGRKLANLLSSSFLYHAAILGGITPKMTVILTWPFPLWVVCWDKFHFGFGSFVLLLN
jgi:hypothetical protein